MTDEFSVLDWCPCGPEVFAQEMSRLARYSADLDTPFQTRTIYVDHNPKKPKDDTPVTIFSIKNIDVLLIMTYNSSVLMRRTEDIESLLNPDNEEREHG